MHTLFNNYQMSIIFLHIISAVIWVGGMIAMRYAAYYSFQNIKQAEVKLEASLYALKKLFIIVAPFVITLLVTAIIMSVALGYKEAAVDANGTVINKLAMHLYNVISIKEIIWTVMTINYIIMIFVRNKAQKLLNNGDLMGAKSRATIIAKYMVPLNIILGLIAIFLGVYLANS